MKDLQVFTLWCLLEVAQSNCRHCHLFSEQNAGNVHEPHLVCVLWSCGADERDLFGLHQFVSELRLRRLKVRKQDESVKERSSSSVSGWEQNTEHVSPHTSPKHVKATELA